MARVSREQYLDAAETLFAERGFYGVSIAAIGAQLGLTKQALLHHFGSKEKLYGEVLQRISERFAAVTASFLEQADHDAEAPRAFFLELYRDARDRPAQTRLLLRELLDNNERAKTAGTWYLRAFLEDITTLVRTLPKWREASDAEALLAAYQIIGAINYYCISAPTLRAIFGRNEFSRGDAQFPKALSETIDLVLFATR